MGVTEGDTIEAFFNLAPHNILAILFKILIVLKEKVLTDYKKTQIYLLNMIVTFFNLILGLKRITKLLRNTEGFETISQPEFWEPICFSPKFANPVMKIYCLWFSIRISPQKSFTEKFVENYVALGIEFIFGLEQLSVDAEAKIVMQGIIQGISQIILKSDQDEFFLKLVSDLPEKSFLIDSESDAEFMKTNRFVGNFRALVKCANCGVLEKSEKQFQKCSRCGFVFYCSKACQKSDWPNHKQICKEIRKQNWI